MKIYFGTIKKQSTFNSLTKKNNNNNIPNQYIYIIIN